MATNPKALRKAAIITGLSALGGAVGTVALHQTKAVDKNLETIYKNKPTQSEVTKTGIGAVQGGVIGAGVGAGIGLSGAGLGRKLKGKVLKNLKSKEVGKLVSATRVLEKHSGRMRLIGGVIGTGLGASIAYKGTKELNQRIKKTNQPSYIANSRFNDSNNLSTFARKLGAKDKKARKKRILQLATTAGAAGIGAVIGHKIGGKLVKPLIKRIGDTPLSRIDYSEMLGLETRHAGLKREAMQDVTAYAKKYQANKDRLNDSFKLGGQGVPKDTPLIVDDVTGLQGVHDYAANRGRQYFNKVKADYRNANRLTARAGKQFEDIGKQYGAQYGALTGIGLLSGARMIDAKRNNRKKNNG